MVEISEKPRTIRAIRPLATRSGPHGLRLTKNMQQRKWQQQAMALTPTQIKAHRDTGILEMHWSDGSVYNLPFKYLRGECPCAGCIDEWTGKRILDLDTIPESIQPEQMTPSGNYAIKIAWSDGHSSGLYTWDHLLDVCRRHTS